MSKSQKSLVSVTSNREKGSVLGEVTEIFSPSSFHPTKSNNPEADLQMMENDLKLVQESGHKPELRRNFSILSLLGVGFGLTNSWFGISASLITGISSGGPMLIIYGIIIIASISTCIGVTLSELSSIYNSAGGQYYWTLKLAPKKYANFWAYMCGAFAWAGSVFTSASVTISIATALVGMYVLGTGDPNKTVETWQVFITYEIVNFLLLFCNIWEKPLPAMSSGALYISLLSFVVITIVILAKASGNYQDAKFVFVTFNNNTGWSSSGIAFIVGLINPAWSFSCLDCATHMSEEILNPERMIPISIMSTVAIGFVTSFVYSISMFFSIKNLDDILNSNTGVPIMDIFYQALNNKAGALILELLIVLTAIGCNIASHTWQARLCWSFARDRGLPGSRYWSKVNTRTGVPVNAHLMSCAWCAIIGCIYMGSTTAYNAMVTACIIFLLLSYSVPTVCLLYKGRNNVKHGPFWLGHFGLFSNVVLICWTVFTTVFFCFPSVMPATAGSMNYASVVFAVFFLYTIIYWFVRGRKTFRVPREGDYSQEELMALEEQLSNQITKLSVILSNGEKGL